MKMILILALWLSGCGTFGSSKESDDFMATELDALSLQLEVIHHMVTSGNHDAAVPVLQQALAQHPDEGLAHYYLGVILAHKNQLELAEASFEYALEKRPNLVAAMDQLGVLHGRRGRFEEAIKWHQSAIKGHRGDPSFFNNFAYTLFLAGNPNEALTQYKHAIALDPSCRITYNNMGFVYGRLEMFKEAQQAFQQAGGDALALANMGLVYQLVGEREMAITSYQRALAVYPDLEIVKTNLKAMQDDLPPEEDDERAKNQLWPIQPLLLGQDSPSDNGALLIPPPIESVKKPISTSTEESR